MFCLHQNIILSVVPWGIHIIYFCELSSLTLSLSWGDGAGGGGAILYHPRHIQFYTSKIFLRASIICDFWLQHIRHNMAKFEGSTSIPSKVTAFFWKVPTTIFVNPGQCPCKFVKTENEIISPKINIFW